jgi:hypothetical protein
MKVQVTVDIEIYSKNANYCGVLCPFLRDSPVHCILSGKKVLLRVDTKQDIRRSTFCKKHQHHDPGVSPTFVKSFLS